MGKQGASLVSRGEASEGDICTTPPLLDGPLQVAMTTRGLSLLWLGQWRRKEV